MGERVAPPGRLASVGARAALPVMDVMLAAGHYLRTPKTTLSQKSGALTGKQPGWVGCGGVFLCGYHCQDPLFEV